MLHLLSLFRFRAFYKRQKVPSRPQKSTMTFALFSSNGISDDSGKHYWIACVYSSVRVRKLETRRWGVGGRWSRVESVLMGIGATWSPSRILKHALLSPFWVLP